MENIYKAFFTTIHTKIKATNEVRNQFGKLLSPDFNIFDFWYIDENKTSQILAHFLNPKATHHQGDTFLKLFINYFSLDFEYCDADEITVECEHITHNNRRIDIVVRKNKFENIIGIENKIYTWTKDQDNQVKDYLSHLSNVTKNNYCLLYLSPNDKTISDLSLSKDEIEKYTNLNRLKIINYEEDIIHLIHSFALLCESERVRFFLLEFEKKLKELFIGENYMDESKMITDYILENDTNLETSLKVAISLQQVKSQLKEEFEIQLDEIAKELNIKIIDRAFYPSNWKKHSIYFNYEASGIIYGIVKEATVEAKKVYFPEIQEVFDEKFKTSNWWPMWQFFYSNIDNSTDFWLDIRNGKAKERAKEFVEIINKKFNTDKY